MNGGQALGLSNDETASGTQVVKQPKADAATEQIWIVGKKDTNGYVAVRNQKAGMFLTATSANVLTIKGTQFSLSNNT